MQANVYPATYLSQKLDRISNFNIVSEFCIKSFRFLVIPLEELAEDSRNTVSNNAPGKLPFSILGQFEFDGSCYALAYDPSIPETINASVTSLLTGRELQIAALIALGWSNKQVANQLHISEWTVSAHLRRIFIKLNVDSRAAMVYRCASLINRLHHYTYNSTSNAVRSPTWVIFHLKSHRPSPQWDRIPILQDEGFGLCLNPRPKHSVACCLLPFKVLQLA